MALTMVTANGWNWIRGADQQNTALPLGPTASCTQIGSHYIGLNATYETPFFVRAYFDPSGFELQSSRYIGYVQILDAKILGDPVRPDLFGGALAQRPMLFANSIVDFMGPGDAIAREPVTGSFPPMYPFNAMLTTNLDRMEQFADTGAPLGFVHFPQGLAATGRTTSLAASLTAQVNLSLLSEDELTRFAAAMELTFTMTRQQLASKTLLNHAVDLIRASTDPQLTDADKSITFADLRLPRFVGRFLLVNVENAEFREPVLCIWTEPSDHPQEPVAFRIAVLDFDAIESLEREATYKLFQRAAADRRSRRIRDPIVAASSAKGRGKPLPLPIKDGDIFATVAVTDAVCSVPLHSTRDRQIVPISGVTFDINLQYDAGRKRLIPAGIANGRQMDSMESVASAISNYLTLVSTRSDRTVDTKNFELVGAPQIESIPAPPP